VLGFEYGYSLDCPEALVIWEAQFGDFANGAQVIVDQFISSAEDKWRRLSGLVLLLPHGYEGAGAEHSSARVERFLQLCAEDNMQVCQPTTPAQIFHLLRRQVLRPYRKPLVVFTPKSLLRSPAAASSIGDLETGRFLRVIGDPSVNPNDARRVLLCTGKVYYDLVESRKQRGIQNVAIIRLEQLYPLDSALDLELAKYAAGTELRWVQDEPWNMGAAWFIESRLGKKLRARFGLEIVSRDESASPATGSHESHKLEQKMLADQAFGGLS
jgi:2-oxoglutarate dehydrogenase E1 component